MSPHYAAEWFRKAETDRTAARGCLRLSRNSEDQAEVVCFHAQQCAEKYLKGILALTGKDVPRTHDLKVLAASLEKILRRAIRLADLERLNAHAVEIRYPGATATRGEALHALASMERIRKACRTALGAAGSGTAHARRPR